MSADKLPCQVIGWQLWFDGTRREGMRRTACMSCPEMDACLDRALEVYPRDRALTWAGVTFEHRPVEVWECHCAGCGGRFFALGATAYCTRSCGAGRPREVPADARMIHDDRSITRQRRPPIRQGSLGW